MLRKLKRAHRSVTLWVNASLLVVVEVLDYAKDAVPMLKEYLAPDTYSAIMLAIIGVNIVLRFKTNKGLEDK